MSEQKGYNPEPGERYIPKAVRSGESFLNSDERSVKINEWRDRTWMNETGRHQGLGYKSASRVEGVGGQDDDISSVHREWFVKSTIPKFIAENPGRKIKIIDLGGGNGLYAKQIRNAFGDKVEVFTTGLKKRAAEKSLELNDKNAKPNKNDLKWRSILELHDFPEFDLIIDTYGEALYSLKLRRDVSVADIEKYFNAVSKKLLPGGHASIDFYPIFEMDQSLVEDVFKDLEKQCGVKIGFEGKDNFIVKIDRPKVENEQK